MPDWQIWGAIGLLGLTSLALRFGGYLAIGELPENHIVARFLRLAPGNMLIAFAAAACLQGGWPGLAGALAALAAMIAIKKDWAALIVGFAAAAAVAALLG